MHNDFNRFKTTLFCHQPDRVPLAELGEIAIPIKERFLGKPIKDIRTDIEFYQRAGYDYYPIVLIPNFNPEHREWHQEQEGIITSLDDFERHPWPKPSDNDYSRLEEAARLIPDEMKIVATTGGFFLYVWSLMGYAQFCYALVDNEELIARMFHKIGTLVTATAKTMLDHPKVGALWISSDIAYTEGLMTSPAVLRQHFFPWFKQLGAICRAKDMPFIYHSDGNLWEVIPDLIAAGVNAIHPLEPKAMDPCELKAKVGDKLCLMGHVDLDRLARGTPAEIDAIVKTNIANLAAGGGYCVGSSNTIADFVNFDNYQAMLDAAMKYGIY